jgi:protein-disulfide isomerase
MVCIIALIVFSILGIFSATHRALAKEALDCVFKRITLRPCNTGFDEKIKGKVIGKLLGRSIFASRIFSRHFAIISWLLFILTIASTFFVVRGGVNYYLYGSCNGLNQSGFCVFDPTGENNKISPVKNGSCPVAPVLEKNLTLANLDVSQFPQKIFGSQNQIVFIGCYDCDYSKKTYPLIQKLVDKNKVDFTFAHIPVKEETSYISNYVYCAYGEDKGKFWSFNEKLFASKKEDVANNEYVKGLAKSIGFDAAKLQQCILDGATRDIIKKQSEQIQATGIYGTPTVFINGKALVGPKPYRVYERMLK